MQQGRQPALIARERRERRERRTRAPGSASAREATYDDDFLSASRMFLSRSFDGASSFA